MFRALIVLALTALLSGCGYNTIQQKDEAVTAAWSQVLNVYKRRADLVPNLVATVKGYASHEQQVLTQVTEARAKVGSINVDANNPESLKQFEQAQGELRGAIGRLLVVSENYPQLKADQGFLSLQTQLEGTENRITVERQRYIGAVQDYNTYIRQFPTNLTAKLFGYSTKPNFTVENPAEIQEAPKVDFGQPAPAAPASTPPAATQPAPAQG
ncbi:LemA family protein [Lysobacter antibioticus]|jgi:LemA protein|uniref:LemA family protein n=1 Tax=Lysobacter antibioticus TaxID=84531 RepID=A0A0S2FF69_LYSAN|nr:LemA family protein [Lysobacter antibioticus]ALN82166.1 lemA family protein [Lysobacter antibioticus]